MPNEIGNYFPEFLAIKQKCKYHNCIHKNEPDCAVKTALENGEIAESRYKNYLNMSKIYLKINKICIKMLKYV